jgi:hypothetical protein
MPLSVEERSRDPNALALEKQSLARVPDHGVTDSLSRD